jgi:hypothetical protein
MLHICYSGQEGNDMNRNKLNDEELLQILFNTNWSDSEDGLDNSDHEQDLNNVQIPEHVDYPTNVNDEGKLIIILTTRTKQKFKKNI